ncbi:MAG: ATP-sensitive inward rectifier potassium channel 10 [Leptolyngbya foveolarum]|uniref:ATP-sensitive inward rectifier potassium channel 10 n=1 Tax=Leptolyngbya foveolarum TaxID=47253 RepID=A0A2W4URM8_9CYAN|nr:MAG: ATP-sensitive inward rectifier potassium channel 10 [Leptolyngbya foveolarum]
MGQSLNDITRTSSTRHPSWLSRVRIHIEEGRFHIVGLGTWYAYWRDPYYLMLTVPWQGFFAITVGSYVLANALAAFLFCLGGPETITNSDGSFLDAFFFSVQTSASIGYGSMTPGTVYANALVTLEAIVAILGIAVLTGLAYARFARPTAQVLFSKVAVVAPFEGTPTLMFRAANERRNQILEAKMRVHLTLDEYSDGRMMRRFYELDLLRDRNPSFFLTWTALHSIDENSPLYGLNHEDLVRTSAALLVSLSGIDQTVNQAIHTRHNYYAGDLKWNKRFKDILYELEDGDRYIDFADFHEVE